MTRSNIISGFKVTGIYPFDHAALIPQSAPEVKFQLPYIPLLTPKRRSCGRKSAELSSTSFDDNDISVLLKIHRQFSCTKDQFDALKYPQPITPPKAVPNLCWSP